MKNVIKLVIGLLVVIRTITYLSKLDDYNNLLVGALIIVVLVFFVYQILGKISGEEEESAESKLVITDIALKEKYPYTETIDDYLLICNDEKFIIKKGSENIFHFDKETKLIQIDLGKKTELIESWNIASIVFNFQRNSARSLWYSDLFVKQRTTSKKLKILELTFKDPNTIEEDTNSLDYLMAFIKATDIADMVSYELNKPYNKPELTQ